MAASATREPSVFVAKRVPSGLLQAAMYPGEERVRPTVVDNRGAAQTNDAGRRAQTPTLGQMIARAYADGRDIGPFAATEARRSAPAQPSPQPTSSHPSLGAIVNRAYYDARDMGPFATTEAQLPAVKFNTPPKATPPRTYMLDPNAMPGFRIKLAPNPDASGERPRGEIPGFSGVKKYDRYIVEAARRRGVDPDIVRAILYMETTHGWYDTVPGVLGLNKSILPMNVNQKYWGNAFGTREELQRPDHNIDQGTRMIAQIQKAMPGASVAEIATVYNNINATRVEGYGARVQSIFEERPWEDRPIPPVNVYVGG